MIEGTKERLESLNKARARGPNGRRLPSAKIKKKTEKDLAEGQTSDSNENIISSIPPSVQATTKGEDDIYNLGRIKAEDFDKIWFIRIPSITGEPDTLEVSQNVADKPSEHSPENKSNSPQSPIKETAENTSKDDTVSKSESTANDSSGDSLKSKKFKWKGKNLCEIL